MSVIQLYLIYWLNIFETNIIKKCSIGFLEPLKKKRSKSLFMKISLNKKNGFTILSSNILCHLFGEIHWWILLKKTVLSLKMLKKTSLNTLKSFKNSFQFAVFWLRASSKKQALLKRLWKNVSSEGLSLSEIEKFSLKYLFATTFKCSKESWFQKIKSLRQKLWKKLEKKVIILLI